jgi:hypothetical protein
MHRFFLACGLLGFTHLDKPSESKQVLICETQLVYLRTDHGTFLVLINLIDTRYAFNTVTCFKDFVSSTIQEIDWKTEDILYQQIGLYLHESHGCCYFL